MELLKTLLDEDGITYSENMFDTEDGIAGLGENTFVSLYIIIYIIDFVSRIWVLA